MKPVLPNKELETTLIDIDFFEGDIDIFVELYNELQKRLLADGYNGYFDAVLFSREWWFISSIFLQIGFAYEAITHFEKANDNQFFGRDERRVISKIRNIEQLCKKAKEFIISNLYEVFIQIKGTGYTVLNEDRFIDPNIAKNPLLLSYIKNYSYAKSKGINSVFKRAFNGHGEDNSSLIMSREVLQVMNLVRKITERGEKQVLPIHTTTESATTKRTIEILNYKIGALGDEKEKGTQDLNTLTHAHNQLISEHDTTLASNKDLEQKLAAGGIKLESLEKQVSHLPKLKEIIRIQSLYIIYQQNSAIQPFLEFNNTRFQAGLRTMLKKHVSDIRDTIGSHLSSTTSNTTIGSGSFSYHVINPLLNQIIGLLDAEDWNGMIHIRNLLPNPKNGDASKGSIYEFVEHTKKIPPMCFSDFFQWLSMQRKVGNNDFSLVFEAISRRIKEKTPALHREMKEFITKTIAELQKEVQSL